MAIGKPLEAAQLSALARFFSSSVVREMACKGASPLLIRLAREAFMIDRVSRLNPVSELFKLAFEMLKRKCHRHEYIYKAALTEKVLLGRHSLQTASMLTEFRVGKCKADVAILNGTATVYEIKSERDSLSRLEHQIDSYKRVFACVYVIAGENHVRTVFENVSDDIGILKLSERHQISTLREARDCPERTSPAAIFDAIRIHEAKELLKLLDVEIPNVPNTEIRRTMRERFLKLDPCDVHLGMVKVLKKTRALAGLAGFLDQLPSSLQTAALSTPLRSRGRQQLLQAVNTRMEDALSWT